MILDEWEIDLGFGDISMAFRQKGIFSFSKACQFINDLPYRRNSTKDDVLVVLKEDCGTCSSKHELIKRLADENSIKDCALVLCIFKMTAKNTPGIEGVLKKAEMDYIPEAHTYITLKGKIFDFTFPEQSELSFLNDVLHTEIIEANQIRTYKAEAHRKYLKTWLNEEGIDLSLEEVWNIREDCIHALSE